MYINFYQNWVSSSVKTVHTNLFAPKKSCCLNLQLPIVILKNAIMSDMHHRITHICISLFSNLSYSRSVKNRAH